MIIKTIMNHFCEKWIRQEAHFWIKEVDTLNTTAGEIRYEIEHLHHRLVRLRAEIGRAKRELRSYEDVKADVKEAAAV